MRKLLAEYLQWKGSHLSVYTVRNYRQYLSVFFAFSKGEKPTYDRYMQFYEYLKDRGLKESTISYYLIALKDFIKFASKRQIIFFSPDLIRTPRFLKESWHPVQKEHITLMLRVLVRRSLFLSLRDELIIRFLFASGVRVSELCSLSLDQISLSKKEAIIISKKNLQRRVIMWDDLTNELMSTYLDLRLPLASSNTVFVNREGTRLSTRQIERMVKKLREKAGIKERIVPHGFRHGFGMDGVASGMNLRYLQILLGHKHITSTQVYMPYKEPNIRKEYRKYFGNRQ